MKTNAAPSMPPAELAHLTAAYGQAGIILEYGSGGSTHVAAQLPGRYVMSVESDLDWTRRMRRELAATSPQALATVYHVDIGATGAWGRPRDESGWRQYHRYPNAIWDEPFFRHPDLILVDGRFRTACLLTALLRVTRPVRVLFDDYADRPKYHRVERLLRPARMIGRMAEFEVVPGMVPPDAISFVISQYFEATTDKQANKYGLAADEKDPALA